MDVSVQVGDIIPSGFITTGTRSARLKGEMLANTGIVDPRVRNPREAIRRARAKLRLYPFIFDELAFAQTGDWHDSDAGHAVARDDGTLAGSRMSVANPEF
ncbi:MAG: hypothetical protein WA741_17890 [Candidatus Sulfotelmatobacter sp.]